jgi:hypothetical protein
MQTVRTCEQISALKINSVPHFIQCTISCLDSVSARTYYHTRVFIIVCQSVRRAECEAVLIIMNEKNGRLAARRRVLNNVYQFIHFSSHYSTHTGARALVPCT